MKVPWMKLNCTKVQPSNKDAAHLEAKISREVAWTTFVCFLLLLATATASYAFWRVSSEQSSLQQSEDELRFLLWSLDDARKILDSGDGAKYFGRVQLLDEDYCVLWSQDLDEGRMRSFIDLDFKDHEDVDARNSDYWSNLIPAVSHRGKRSLTIRPMDRYVSCERFRAVPRGRYLVSPSLTALRTCYKRGLRPNELEAGGERRRDDKLRYDLKHLYVRCEDAFDENLDELTDELREDLARCKLSGALGARQHFELERRFAERLTTGSLYQAPDNLLAMTTLKTSLDLEGFVDCSHVETELFEDYFESPSLEALQRCQSFGVTLAELDDGIARNPDPSQRRNDVSSLYLPCQDVFSGHVNYMTVELKEDYLRCKRIGALSPETQRSLEKRFYETLHDGTAEKSAEKPAAATLPTTSTADYETSATPISSSTARNRYAFANCKRIENTAYLICIKIIKVYSAPIQYI